MSCTPLNLRIHCLNLSTANDCQASIASEGCWHKSEGTQAHRVDLRLDLPQRPRLPIVVQHGWPHVVVIATVLIVSDMQAPQYETTSIVTALRGILTVNDVRNSCVACSYPCVINLSVQQEVLGESRS